MFDTTDNNSSYITQLARLVGTSVPAFRILISLLLAYPLALFHRAYLYGKPGYWQHLFFILAGSGLGYFNFGEDIVNGYICIAVHYVVLNLMNPNTGIVVFTYCFQMAYLLYIYWTASSDIYTPSWAMPHCVLTLRLIGQMVDFYDGAQLADTLSTDQKERMLKTAPNLLEVAGHVFYPGGFLIGPQFPLKRYLDFVNRNFSETQAPPQSVQVGLKKLLIGLIYVGIYQLGNSYVGSKYLESGDYEERNFLQKLLLVGLYGKVLLYKYVSCWIVAEGSCILSGIAYNGRNENGQELWNGCANVNIALFESSYTFAHLINSFNKCTNQWIAHYVFKRLKFMKSVLFSKMCSMLFLAVWHGFHSGYYMCFFLEFLVMKMEKDLEILFGQCARFQRWHQNAFCYRADVVVLKLLVICCFGYCLLPFGLLTIDKWGHEYSRLYFSVSIILVGWNLFATFHPGTRDMLTRDVKKTS